MNPARYRIHDLIFWYSSLLIAFFLPVYGRIVPLFIALMLVNWIVDGRFIRNTRLLFKERWRILTLSFSLLYLLYLAGMIYTTNFDYGWFDMEIKLSLLIFPLVFATSEWPVFSGKRVEQLMLTFTAGCFAGGLILLGNATVNSYSLGIPGSYSYTRLAWYFHATYLSMYYNLAVVFLVLFLISGKTGKGWLRFSVWALLLFLSHMIFLLASKAGIISYAIGAIMLSGYALFKLKRARLAGILISGALAVFVAEYFITPAAFSRMSAAENVMVKKQDSHRVKAESNADRLAVWNTSAGIIKHHFLFGVGTGDVKDALLEGYRENNVIPALEHKFNAHSQYIQTFITLGLIGFLVLAATLIIPAIIALRTGQILYLLFLVIFAFNILFESMLEIQQGVVFYAFFNILLFTEKRNGNPAI